MTDTEKTTTQSNLITKNSAGDTQSCSILPGNEQFKNKISTKPSRQEHEQEDFPTSPNLQVTETAKQDQHIPTNVISSSLNKRTFVATSPTQVTAKHEVAGLTEPNCSDGTAHKQTKRVDHVACRCNFLSVLKIGGA